MVAALVPWSLQSTVTGQALHKVLDLVDAFSQHEPDMDDASNLDALKHSMNTLLTRRANFTHFSGIGEHVGGVLGRYVVKAIIASFKTSVLVVRRGHISQKPCKATGNLKSGTPELMLCRGSVLW